MKKFFIFIFLSLMFLLGTKNMDVPFPENEKVSMNSILPTGDAFGSVYSSVTALPERGDAYVDSESLARQFRICGRGHRSSVQHVLIINKGSAYRLANRQFERLFHSINHIYTSLPRQSWAVSTLHYVFELRHILI